MELLTSSPWVSLEESLPETLAPALLLDEQVGLAPPDGRGALTAKPQEKLAAYL